MKIFPPFPVPDSASEELRKINSSLQIIYDILAYGDAQNALPLMLPLLKEIVAVDSKRSVSYKSVAAVAVYYMAYIAYKNGANDNAEKTLAKAQSILEILAKKDAAQYGEALMMAIEASTTVFKSRLKQLNTLAHYQAAVSTYTMSLSTGGVKALNELIATLRKEGELLYKMGNDREAVKYFTQALKYLGKKEKNLGKQHLEISICLGRALLNLFNRQDTARELLQSLIPLAVSIGAHEQLEEIEYILANSPKKDIIDTLKLIFK